MSLTFTILGCANSTGVPAIGNRWRDCDPNNPKNRRDRAGFLVQSETTNIVIDTSPDFRHQINRAGINHIDAVLYSHSHSDHIGGMDELRIFTNFGQNPMPIYCDEATLEGLRERFPYLLDGDKSGLYTPVIKPQIISDFGKPHRAGDINYIPFIQDHGICESLGFRFGKLGYSTDFLRLDDLAIETLKGVDIWIADCSGYKSENHPSHANLATIYELVEKIGAKQTYLIGLSPIMDYETLRAELPDGIEPAFDGLVIKS
jgi:phosphoribosyl 1,2-cyclic phosphate phosphodiesterase